MAIQQSINTVLGTAGTVSTLQQHLKDQETKRAAEVNTAAQSLESNQEALKNDQYEAQQAILAHATEEGLSKEEIEKLEKDPSYAQELRETVMKERRKQQLALAGEKFNNASEDKLAKDYKGKLMLDQQGNPMTEKDVANRQLSKAYESFRELNSRIDATRQLKFNITNAKKIIESRGTGKEIKNILGGKQ